MEKRRVVITGMGAVTPIGNTVADSWAAAKAGTCGIGPITRYDPSAQKAKLAGEVKNFDPEALLGKRECKRMDRFTQLALISADQSEALDFLCGLRLLDEAAFGRLTAFAAEADKPAALALLMDHKHKTFGRAKKNYSFDF